VVGLARRGGSGGDLPRGLTRDLTGSGILAVEAWVVWRVVASTLGIGYADAVAMPLDELVRAHVVLDLREHLDRQQAQRARG